MVQDSTDLAFEEEISQLTVQLSYLTAGSWWRPFYNTYSRDCAFALKEARLVRYSVLVDFTRHGLYSDQFLSVKATDPSDHDRELVSMYATRSQDLS